MSGMYSAKLAVGPAIAGRRFDGTKKRKSPWNNKL